MKGGSTPLVNEETLANRLAVPLKHLLGDHACFGWAVVLTAPHPEVETIKAVDLPFEIGLSLFRVLQEAPHNAVKHSGVKRFDVQLVEHSNQIHLVVTDGGRGFDIEAATQGRGLGLTYARTSSASKWNDNH